MAVQIHMYQVPNRYVEILRIMTCITRRYVPLQTSTSGFVLQIGTYHCSTVPYQVRTEFVLLVAGLLRHCTAGIPCTEYVQSMYSVHTCMYLIYTEYVPSMFMVCTCSETCLTGFQGVLLNANIVVGECTGHNPVLSMYLVHTQYIVVCTEYVLQLYKHVLGNAGMYLYPGHSPGHSCTEYVLSKYYVCTCIYLVCTCTYYIPSCGGGPVQNRVCCTGWQ